MSKVEAWRQLESKVNASAYELDEMLRENGLIQQFVKIEA